MTEQWGGDPPNYTQIPNALLDRAMALMSGAELKVVLSVCRRTIGWHKRRDRISLTQLQQMTGLSRHSVIDAVRSMVAAGWIEQFADGDSFAYQFHVIDFKESSAEISPSAESALTVVQKVHQPSAESAPELVQKVHTQKKGKKLEKKEKESDGAPARAALAVPDQTHDESGSAEPQRRTLYGNCFVAVARACSMDERVPMLAKRISVAAKYLAQREVGPECIAEFGGWWHLNDWRGKRGDLPTPERVTELWLQFERRGQVAAVAQPAAPVSRYSSTQRKPQAMFTPEQRRAIEEQARRELEEEGEL